MMIMMIMTHNDDHVTSAVPALVQHHAWPQPQVAANLLTPARETQTQITSEVKKTFWRVNVIWSGLKDRQINFSICKYAIFFFCVWHYKWREVYLSPHIVPSLTFSLVNTTAASLRPVCCLQASSHGESLRITPRQPESWTRLDRLYITIV